MVDAAPLSRFITPAAALSGLVLIAAAAMLSAGGCAEQTRDSATGMPAKFQTNEESRPNAGGSNFSAGSLVNAGKTALARGDRQQALAEFIKAIEVNPTLTDAHLGVADVYFSDGNYAAAEPGYRKAAQLEPRNYKAQYYHGLVLHLLNRTGEAVSAYLRALTVQPNDFDANVNLASAYYALGDHRQALPYAERSVQINPRHGQARFNLGAIFASLDRHELAVIEYQQAAELMELSPDLLLRLSESLAKLQRWDEAKNTLLALTKSKPSAPAWERLGTAEFRLNSFADATNAFNQAIALDPNYFPALNGLGVCELNTWLESNQTDDGARQRGLTALRKSLSVNRAQPKVEDILSRYR